VKRILTLAILVLALAARAAAQVQTGEAKLNLNGTVSAGYSDDYTNNAGSDHGISGAGITDLSGSYYNPSFLSFDVQPFYNQSRLNSSYQSMTASSGVNARVALFGGSNFPGAISYTSSFNSSGNFDVPGLANYTTHGNTDNLAIGWGVRLDGLPNVNLSFSRGNSAYSIYGVDTQGTMHDDTFSATTAYRIDGFKLNGGYQYSGISSLTPELIAGELPQQSHTGTNSLFLGMGHDLPWHGNIFASADRLDIHSNFGDTSSTDKYDTSIDTLSGGFAFAPRAHLNVGGDTYYTDNLEGTLYNTLVAAGVTVPETETAQSSHSLSLTGYANYDMPAQHLNLRALVEREQQTFMGEAYASDIYNGTVSYANKLLGGQFNGVLGFTRTSLNTSNQGTMGVNTSINYTHQIERWTVAGSFGYSQDTQTVLIAYTSSGYNYSGNLARRIRRRSYWGAYVSGAKSLLTDEPGTANSSHTYSTSFSIPRFSMNGSYSESSGNALLTSTGLVATPVPVTALNPAAVVLYNGKSYSMGFGSNPLHGLTLSASYAKALSATNSTSTSSNNNSKNMNFLVIYNFRKLNFNAGYSRLFQGFSATGTPPALVGSFYVGISRWFNFF
jgi:hypothetical protein